MINYTLGVSIPDFTDGRPARGVPAQNLLSGLSCSGSEERLADCDHDGLNVVPTGCSRAYVQCKTEGKTRIEIEGRYGSFIQKTVHD